MSEQKDVEHQEKDGRWVKCVKGTESSLEHYQRASREDKFPHRLIEHHHEFVCKTCGREALTKEVE